MPAQRIENNDVLKIYECVGDAVRRIRSGESGPFFFECMTYRLMEHVGPNEDFGMGYRTRQEASPWLENDQLERMGELVAPSVRDDIAAQIESDIAEAFEFAEQSPFPDSSDLHTDVYR